MPHSPSPVASPRLRGLDGLRAIAVALVVLYHLFPQGWLRGGFIGVDVFFVISGFLITTLLLGEHARTGGIGLARFWLRRARRLLPALVAVLTVCSTAAWLIGGDVLVRLGEQVIGALTFSYNWVSIAGGSGYFSGGTPELFRNLWSLAVEEQFYVLWPLALPLFLLLPRAWMRSAGAVALAAVSAVWMGVLVGTGGDVTRAYFGTDSHAFGLLLGVALAFGLRRLVAAPPAWSRRRGWRTGALAAGCTAVCALVAVALVPVRPDVLTFPGASLAACLLTAVAIVAGVLPGSWFGATIDIAPLRLLGDRSYGIYLWHWPLLVLLTGAIQGTTTDVGVPAGIGVLTLGATVVVAEISYRLIEMPVRRYGFRGSLRRLRGRIAGPPLVRFRALVAIFVGAMVLGGTSAAIAAAPDVSSAQSYVQAGQAALSAAAGGAPGVDPPRLDPAKQKTAQDAAASADPSSAAPAPSGSATPIAGSEISAIGDSVMLASAPSLLARFPGIQIDAAVSRSMWAGPGIAQALADAGQLRPYVVVALGTNGPVDRGSLDQLAGIVGTDRHLVLVNAFAPRSWIAGVDADLAAFAAAHPGVVVADWAGAIAPHTDLLAGDQIHPGDAGGRIFADAVAGAVDQIEVQRVQAQNDRDRRRGWMEQGLRTLMSPR